MSNLASHHEFLLSSNQPPDENQSWDDNTRFTFFCRGGERDSAPNPIIGICAVHNFHNLRFLQRAHPSVRMPVRKYEDWLMKELDADSVIHLTGREISALMQGNNRYNYNTKGAAPILARQQPTDEIVIKQFGNVQELRFHLLHRGIVSRRELQSWDNT